MRGTFSGELIQAYIAIAGYLRCVTVWPRNSARLVADADVDAERTPLALHHLLDQLARAVAGGGHELEGEPLALALWRKPPFISDQPAASSSAAAFFGSWR